MNNTENVIPVFDTNKIQNLIYTIRGVQVMLDSDLAQLYGVSTSRLNEQVKRNIARFPNEFMFQLTKNEFENLMSQIAISSINHGGRRKLPYVFTEQGVAMLSSVLRSETAVKISIQIMNAFVGMRKFLTTNAQIFQRINTIEKRQLQYEIKTDEKFEKVFDALQNRGLEPNHGIFYDGQIFDAYKFVSDIIRSAKKSIAIIDNYVDDSVLKLLSKRKNTVKATIYTKNITKVLQQDLNKHNKQYAKITMKQFTNSHDRFIIIDEDILYHFGASLKDLGKKWFAFSKLDLPIKDILDKLN